MKSKINQDIIDYIGAVVTPMNKEIAILQIKIYHIEKYLKDQKLVRSTKQNKELEKK